MRRIVLIGGGGFAKEVAEIVELNKHCIVGCVDDASAIKVPYPFWGPLKLLKSYRTDFDAIALGIGAVDRSSMAIRARIVEWIRDLGFPTTSVVSPKAVVSRGVKIADSVFVGHGVVISVDANIEDFVILNSQVTVGHDACIGSLSVIAPGAFIGGMTSLGAQCLIGPGAQILQGLTVGHGSIVSVGSVVLRSLSPESTVVPLRPKIITGI